MTKIRPASKKRKKRVTDTITVLRRKVTKDEWGEFTEYVVTKIKRRKRRKKSCQNQDQKKTSR